MPYTAHPESRFDRSRGVSDPKLTHLSQRQRLNTIKSMVESIENIRNGAVDTPKKVDSKNEKAKISNQNKTQHQNARPADSLEVSEGNKTDNYDQDDQEKASGLGHVWESEKTRPRSAVLKAAVSSPPICQLGLIEHESLDIGSRRPIVQPVLSRSEDKRIRQEPDDATVPEPASQYQNSLASNVDLRTFANFRISPLLDSFNSKFDIGQEVSWTDEGKIYSKFPANPLADRAMAYPTLSSTLPDPDLEAGVTAQDKEKERRYSNGRDHTERPASTSVALEPENAETRDIDTEMAATSAMSERREAENTERRERAEIDDRLAHLDRVEVENTERRERAEKADRLAQFDKLKTENTETRDRDAEPVSRLPQIKKRADFLVQETRNITRRQSLPSLQSLQTHTPPSTLNLNRVSMTVSTTSHGIHISQMRELEPQMMEMARWDNSRLLRRVSMDC